MSKNFKKPKDYYFDRREILPFIPKDKKVFLDVGCGEGGFGALLKQVRQAEVWGVENDQEIGKKAVARLDRVIVDTIESDDIMIPESYFDCIVFNDCLEHLYDPWSVLGRIKKFMKKDGMVIASIPNVRYYNVISDLIKRKRWDYVDTGVLDRTHLRFFTIETIKSMFLDCGYTLINISGINSMGLPPFARFLNRIIGGRFEDMRYQQFACVAKLKN